MTEARNANLGFKPSPSWFRVTLRADAIREATLKQLADAWNQDPFAVDALLLALAKAAHADAVTAAVEDIEVDCGMDLAEVEIDRDEARRLLSELRSVIHLIRQVLPFPRLQPPRRRRPRGLRLVDAMVPFPAQQGRRSA